MNLFLSSFISQNVGKLIINMEKGKNLLSQSMMFISLFIAGKIDINIDMNKRKRGIKKNILNISLSFLNNLFRRELIIVMKNMKTKNLNTKLNI